MSWVTSNTLTFQTSESDWIAGSTLTFDTKATDWISSATLTLTTKETDWVYSGTLTFDTPIFNNLGLFEEAIKKIERQNVSADVTRRALTLGTIDSTSGWYAKTFSNSLIKMVVQPKNTSLTLLGFGYHAIYDITGFTAENIVEGDEIVTIDNNVYVVKSVQPEWFLDKLSHYVCELTKKTLKVDRPATFGTASLTTEPRATVKTLLDTYITDSALTKDDGVTEASWITCYSNPDYPISLVLSSEEKDIDAVFTLSPVTVNPVMFNGVTVGYTQTLTVTIFAVDKTDITAQNLLWKAEAELRSVIETYGLGSMRISSSQSKSPLLPPVYSREYDVTIPVELDVTLRTLSLSTTPDTITGWYPKTYATNTIQMSFNHKGTNTIPTTAGTYIKYDLLGITSDAILEGDQILYNSNYYEVTAVQVHPVTSLTSNTSPFNYYFCYLTKLPLHIDRASTSGIWHVDSESIKTDPRNRMKTFIDTYIASANITKDDGATAASTLTYFENPEYPIPRLLSSTGKNLDAVATLKTAKSTPLLTHDHHIYAFNETIEIQLYAVNKTGITATNLLEKYEQEIRHVITDHPTGSIRSIESIDATPIDVGNATLYSTKIIVAYKRTNYDYTPTTPTITWGPSGSPTGTFTFPNVTNIKITGGSSDIHFLPPSRIGNITQSMGDEGITITLTCDLDVENTTLTWKRPQSSAPKIDRNNFDVFLDIKHNGAINQNYQTLNLGWGGTLKVRFAGMEPDLVGEGNVMHISFREYRATSASSETYVQRFGLT